MKKSLFFFFVACIIDTSYGTAEQDAAAQAAALQEKVEGARRLLTNTGTAADIRGPCVRFVHNNTQCGDTPGLNHPGEKYKDPDTGLSAFAHDWVSHTCCKVVTEPMAGIVSSVWLWLQVCTKAMNKVNANEEIFMELDKEFAKEKYGAVMPYKDGPLHSMKRYCPQDLDGGELSEWVVTTFFPVMRTLNPNFKRKKESSVHDDCQGKKANAGAVTVLLTEPEELGNFGHFAMVLHDDAKLLLPDTMNTTHYVSFSNFGNTIGAIITGTRGVHKGFGMDLENVTKVLTLYHADVPKMLQKWDDLQHSGLMFDLLEWNCARTALEILSAGYPDCQMELNQLWTPERAYDIIVNEMAPKINDAVAGQQSVQVKDITARQIPPPEALGVSATVVVAIALCCFFGTLLLAILVAVIVIMKIKADAAQQLDRNLANLLISASSTSGLSVMGTVAKEQKTNAKKNSVVPDPGLGNTIQQTMEIGQTDGKTDKQEFMNWAKEHNFNAKQARLMWSDLDRDHNNQVTRSEWEKYIDKRPNLKWLATRLQSVAKH